MIIVVVELLSHILKIMFIFKGLSKKVFLNFKNVLAAELPADLKFPADLVAEILAVSPVGFQ